MADLFLTTENNFEVWYGYEDETRKFVYNKTIPHPDNAVVIGQSTFIDVELRGRMDLVTPVCYDADCRNSALLVYSDGNWHNLQVNFKDNNNNFWGFALRPGTKYMNAITLHRY